MGFMNRIKSWYSISNRKWHEEEQRKNLALMQEQAIQQKQYLADISRNFLLFFRPLLGKVEYFDTTAMRCDATDSCGSMHEIWLQIPLRASARNRLPSTRTLQQIIENLLVNESALRMHTLNDRAYRLQASCYSPADIEEYNKMVIDSECYFMKYNVAVKQVDSFKIVLAIGCILNKNRMQSFYL